MGVITFALKVFTVRVWFLSAISLNVMIVPVEGGGGWRGSSLVDYLEYSVVNVYGRTGLTNAHQCVTLCVYI